ncbi:unnamed protein product, partial [Thlaspi arvense]
MGEQRQFRSRSWNRMPAKRCSANGIMNEFIVVDDDEVIILDTPESSKSKAPGTSRTRNEPVLPRVISLDDEDDDDAADDTENVPKAGSGSSCNPLAANLQTSAEVDNDDCQFIQEKRATFRFTKCKHTHSTKSSTGIRFGLGSESDSDVSESDCSDCEILDGSQREVREQWEKAFFEKMKKAGKAGLSEEAGPSNLHCDTDFESRTEEQDQASSFFAARNPDGGKETSSTLFGTEKSGKAGLSEEGPSDLHRDTNLEPGFESRAEQQDQTSFVFAARNPDGGKETSSTFYQAEKPGKADLSEEAGPSVLHCDTNFGPGFESRTEHHAQTSYFVPARNPDGGEQTSSTLFGTDDRNASASLFGSQMEEDNRAKNFINSRFSSKEKFPWFSSQSPEIQVERERSDQSSAHCTSSKEPMHQNSFKEVEEQLDTVQVQCKTSQLPKENQMKRVPKEKQKKKSPKENQKRKAADQSYSKEVVEEEVASKSSQPQPSDGDGDTTHVLGTQSNGARCEHGNSSLGDSSEPITDPIPSTSGQVQGLNGTAPAIDVMLNREMLKETDEYKKAQEEEWESRQQQLQLQAEEAQRQRKRIKLANTRQLEMERRQKERVEEVRETQKKDEESMNMKEKVRAEITKSLRVLELKCNNLASLLRGLGIPVGGGTSPLPHE